MIDESDSKVDDHRALAHLACEILQMEGYRAECAYTASDALVKFEHDKFDMLVTDYRMAEMNGLELAKLIRQKAPDLPVIIVSGYAAKEAGDDSAVALKSRRCSPPCSKKSSPS